jgi:hypothetical protein
MNSYIGKHILPDLLVMGRIGVLVDAPNFTGQSLADVPRDFRPYIYCYPVEQIPLLVESEVGSQSDFKAVLLTDQYSETNYLTGVSNTYQSYRYYYINDDTGFVNLQLLDKDGVENGPVIELRLKSIPFVMFDIGDSLIKDVCRHQVALMNLISSDTSYAIESNFPFLTKQVGNNNAGQHLKGEDEYAEVGLKKGLTYPRNSDRPQFVSPPTEPMKASLMLRKEIKDEVRELVSGAISDLGDEGTIESGLAAIGLELERGENRVAAYWATYEHNDIEDRDLPTIKYPEQWSLKTTDERIEEASKLSDTMYKVPGRKVKKEIAKLAAAALLRGKVKTEVLDEIMEDIDKVPYCTSDPKTIIAAKKQGLISDETGALALGGTPDEYKKAQEDQARRAAAIVAAQSDAAAARGNPDGSADPSSPDKEKEGASDAAGKLGGEREDGVRGEGEEIKDEGESI